MLPFFSAVNCRLEFKCSGIKIIPSPSGGEGSLALLSDWPLTLFVAAPAPVIIPVLSLAVILFATLGFVLSLVLPFDPWLLLMLYRRRLRFLLVYRRGRLLLLIAHCRTLALRSRMNLCRLDRSWF